MYISRVSETHLTVSLRLLVAGSPKARYAMVAVVSQSSVVRPLGQISKSKRDRLETRRPSHHRTLLGNWHQRFCCRIQLLPLRRCHWRYSGFKYKMCAYIKILILYYCLYYCLFILCVFLLNLRYFLCYHVMVNKVVYILIRPRVRLSVTDHSCCKPSATVISLPECGQLL